MNKNVLEAIYMFINRRRTKKIWYIDTMEYYSALKKNKLESFLGGSEPRACYLIYRVIKRKTNLVH